MQFERTTIVPTTIERAFELSLDVDLHAEGFADSNESAIDGVMAGAMQAGDTVTWRARHFGIWWTMTSEIVEYDPPRFFVDQQKRGPFKRFHHEHHFEQLGDGTTKMIDRIDFDAPLGILGRIAERAVLGRYLPKLIDQRNDFLVTAARRDAEVSPDDDGGTIHT